MSIPRLCDFNVIARESPPPPVFLQSTNSRFFFFSKFTHSRDAEKSYFTFTQRKKNRFCWLLRRLHPSLNLPKKILHNGIFAKSDQFYVLAWQSYFFWFLITDVFSRLYLWIGNAPATLWPLKLSAFIYFVCPIQDIGYKRVPKSFDSSKLSVLTKIFIKNNKKKLGVGGGLQSTLVVHQEWQVISKKHLSCVMKLNFIMLP